MRRVCIRRGPDCSNPWGYAEPGKSRCKAHGGGSWARQPRARQQRYSDPVYLANRRKAVKREPVCHWGLPGCTRIFATADHVVSIARGGTHDLGNLVGSCRSCNEKRGAAEGRRTFKKRSW